MDLLSSNPRCSIVVSFRISLKKKFPYFCWDFLPFVHYNISSSALLVIVVLDGLKSLSAVVNILVVSCSVSVDYFFSWVWVTFSCFFICWIFMDYILDIMNVMLWVIWKNAVFFHWFILVSSYLDCILTENSDFGWQLKYSFGSCTFIWAVCSFLCARVAWESLRYLVRVYTRNLWPPHHWPSPFQYYDFTF